MPITSSGARAATIVVRVVDNLLLPSPISHPVTLYNNPLPGLNSVENGGTGVQNITLNSIIYGQGTSPVAEASGSAYEILQLDENGIPTFSDLDGGEY